MKGIAHFATGVAVATCFPQIVYSASNSLSFAPLLGGFAGLLPDTLDFRFGRYLQRLDAEVDPAKLTTETGYPDPQAIANSIARAMNEAWDSGRQIKIQLHTVRVGADLWRRYTVTLDVAHSQVVVRIGPVVTTGQVPLAGHEAGGELPGPLRGEAPVKAPILPTYDAETRIDIFSGPTLAFQRVGQAVEVTFLPWHRAWSHSLALVLSMGLAGFILAPVVGLSMALASLAHIVEDQVGYMGSNLFFPLTRSRTNGLEWMRSGDAIPNFLVVWLSLAVIFFNLDRFSSAPSLPVLPYVLGVMVAPALFFLGLGIWRRGRGERPQGEKHPQGEERSSATAQAAVEALDEMEEIVITQTGSSGARWR
ncbi:hypothetical protein ACFLWA_11580 [Chloroflexota bacterium]